MADNFTFELVSPEKLLLSGDAEMVTIPGAEGDMGILANHAAVMTSLRPGMLNVKMSDGTETTYFVRGGFADITPSGVTVLAQFSVAKAELTAELMGEQVQSAQAALEAAQSGNDTDKTAHAYAFLEQLKQIEASL